MRKTVATPAQRRRQIHFLDRTLMKTKTWLKEIEREIDLDSEQDAYVCLRAVLHALRDRLTVNETAEFAAQLPMLIRGMYYDGWKPAGKPDKGRNVQVFLADIAAELAKSRPPGGPDVLSITLGIVGFLEGKISPGEMNDIKACLPRELKKLWGSPAINEGPYKNGQPLGHSVKPHSQDHFRPSLKKKNRLPDVIGEDLFLSESFARRNPL